MSKNTLRTIVRQHIFAARRMTGFDRRFWRARAKASIAAYRAAQA